MSTQKVGDLDVETLKLIIKESNNEMLEKLNELSSDVAELKKQNEYLSQEIEKIKAEKNMDKIRLAQLEDHIKKQNLIFKGLTVSTSTKEAVDKVCKEVLQINDASIVKSTKKIYERDGKMTVLAEIRSEKDIGDIFKKSSKLAGTTIYVERDLNLERQQDKKVMMQLKKDIMAISSKHRIGVRDDRMKVANKWLRWNKDKKLVCGMEDANITLQLLYENRLQNVKIDYNILLSKIISKN
ncbi:uncharacterized protein LOC129238211 [Anastrepha obliqua]|uniref:uncharacterized protein LOC129238211 n=1 Tax=Anastrepha obliqua TaxID=95512 RepID=UPI0024090896|nr:uncharacterized protein LOC129238211 [Anastrepha obliqua]